MSKDRTIDNINPFENPVLISCTTKDYLPLKEIVPFQGSLKKLSSANREKLIKSILSDGFMCPIFIWNNNGNKKVLDGHQRLHALLYLESHGWEIPDLPVVYIYAANEKDAKQKLLKITSQYGEFNTEELTSWIADIDDDIIESIRLVDSEIDLIISDLGTETDPTDSDIYSEDIGLRYQLVIDIADKMETEELCKELVQRGYVCKVQEIKELEQND